MTPRAAADRSCAPGYMWYGCVREFGAHFFSYAARRVGWGEDGSGKLRYDPMASCDKSVLTAYIPPAASASGTGEAAGESGSGGTSSALTTVPVDKPGAYRKLQSFLAENTSAAHLAAVTVKDLFTSVVSSTDDDDDSDAEDDGERAPKRKKKGGGRKCRKGAIVSRAEHRKRKQEIKQGKDDKKQKAKDELCKEYDRRHGVRAQWDALTQKHIFLLHEHTADQVTSKLNVSEMKVYIEMRTKKKPPSQLARALAVAEVARVVSVSTALREGDVPDGYEEWKERERERELPTTHAPATPPLLSMAPAAAPNVAAGPAVALAACPVVAATPLDAAPVRCATGPPYPRCCMRIAHTGRTHLKSQTRSRRLDGSGDADGRRADDSRSRGKGEGRRRHPCCGRGEHAEHEGGPDGTGGGDALVSDVS